MCKNVARSCSEGTNSSGLSLNANKYRQIIVVTLSNLISRITTRGEFLYRNKMCKLYQ